MLILWREMFTFHLLSTYAVWQTHPQKVQLVIMLPMPLGYCISILLQMGFHLLILITLPILSLTSIQYGK